MLSAIEEKIDEAVSIRAAMGIRSRLVPPWNVSKSDPACSQLDPGDMRRSWLDQLVAISETKRTVNTCRTSRAQTLVKEFHAKHLRTHVQYILSRLPTSLCISAKQVH
jgi:hypothetical protein